MSDAALWLTVALPGLQALSVGLSRLRADISDWTAFWRDRFGPSFYRQILEDFVLEGGSSGQRWAPLSSAYAAWKASRFPGAGILVRSGQLKASLLGPDAPHAIFRPGPTSLEVGTSVPYAIYHQTGAQWMKHNAGRAFGTNVVLPQRPPIRLTPAFMRVVGQNLQRFVQDAWTLRRQAFIADVKAGVSEGLA